MTISNTHPLNGPLSGTTQVSRYQKGKTNLDFTGARDSEWQWHQLGHMQVCTSLQTENHASTPPLSFLQAGCPSCRPTNSVKALMTICKNNINDYVYRWRDAEEKFYCVDDVRSTTCSRRVDGPFRVQSADVCVCQQATRYSGQVGRITPDRDKDDNDQGLQRRGSRRALCRLEVGAGFHQQQTNVDFNV